MRQAQGAVVDEPQSGSPAAKAEVKGAPVNKANDLARKIPATEPGTDVQLEPLRNGQEKTVSVTLGQLPNQRQANVRDNELEQSNGVPNLGLSLAPASEIEGAGDVGVAVVAIDPSRNAAERVRTGDVILSVGDQAVSKPSDVRKAIADLRRQGKQAALMRIKSGNEINPAIGRPAIQLRP